MPKRSGREYHVAIIDVVDYFDLGESYINLLYVLKGSIVARRDEKNLTLNSGDVQVFNRDSWFQLSGQSENMLVLLSVSTAYLARYIEGVQNYRFTIEKTDGEQYITLLRALMTRLAICELQDNKETGRLEMNGHLSDILRLLMLHFKSDALPGQRGKHYSARVAGVINHIHAHYDKDLSLNMMAKLYHTSLAYLSRLFTLEVGVSFKHYLTQLRFERSVNEMAQTERPLYQIVQDNGFTSTRNFTKLFKKQYGVTPHHFREEYREGKRTLEPICRFSHGMDGLREPVLRAIHSAELLTLLTNSLSENWQTMNIEPLKTENITIAVEPVASAPMLPKQTYVITVGKLDELLKSDIQQQVMAIKQSLPLRYIEAHHLITGDTILPEFVSDEAFPSFLPYNNTDLAIGFLKQQGIALLVRINVGSITQDLALYEQKLLSFLCHNINVFGMNYVSTWCFICYPGEQPEQSLAVFTEHYGRLRKRIKQLMPESRTGIFYPFPSIREEIANCAFFRSELTRHIDFLGYSANPNEHIDFQQFNKDSFDKSEHFVQQRTSAIVQQLKKRDLEIPLFLQTWNTLTGETRHTNGSFFRGALLLNTLLDLPAQVASIGFWINSQTQNEALKDARIDISSLALFYIHSTRRPIFHVLYLRERMQGEILAKGKHYLVTRTTQGYRVLLTHNVTLNPYLSLQHHLVNGFKKGLYVTVRGLRSGVYQIKKRVFDQQHGALYRQFELQHTCYGRDEEVLQWISQRSSPTLSVYDEAVEAVWNTFAEMDINAIYLFELNRIANPPFWQEAPLSEE